MNTLKTKTKLSIIYTFVLAVFVSIALPLFVSPQKASAALADSEDEQYKRREVVALKYCIEKAGFAPIIYDNFGGHISDFDLFNPYKPTQGGLQRAEAAPFGSDIKKNDDGSVNCSDLDGIKGYLGFDFQTLWDKKTGLFDCPGTIPGSDCWILNDAKVEELKNKANDFINARVPLPEQEMKKRVRYHLENICAERSESIDDPRYFVVDGQNFRYKDGKDAGSEILFGMDYDFDGAVDGIVKCGGLVLEANKIHALLDSEGNPVDPGTGTGDSKTETECDFVSWNPLKWFLCPVIKIAETAVSALDNLITYMLTFPTNEYFDNNDGMKNAWARLRNLSIGLLLIAGLVMVISQAIGYGPFDAYTIKRVIPRMLFAIIFISISLPVLRVMIEFTNIAGVGVRNLIESSFSGSSEFGTVSFGNGGLLIGNLGMVGIGLSLGFFGMLSLLGTALLGVLIAFFVLAARQMVIIMLVVLAPIAIACYILPNTEKIWKMWWDFFIRAIFAFPIISMFIAVGHAFASIAAHSTTLDDSDAALKSTIGSLIAFAAYFGPYFALPYAFRLAGGAVAQIGGVVNDRSRGAFDRMKNFRKQKSAQNMSDWAHGDRFSSNNVLARGVNRVGIGAKSGWKGRFGMGRKGEEARARILQTGGAAALANNAELSGLLDRNDDAAAVLGLSGGTTRGAREAAADLQRAWIRDGATEAEAQERAQRALAAASAVGITRQNAGAAWTKVAQNKSRAIPGGDIETIQRGAQRLGYGNASAVQELAWGQQFYSRGAGRIAEGGDWSSAEVQGHLSDAAAARAAGDDAAAERHLFEAQRATFMDGVKRTGVASIVGGHSSSIAMARQIVQDDFASGDVARRMESAVLLSELAGQLPGATGENRDNIVRTLLDAGIDPSMVEAAGKAPVAIGTNPDGSIKYEMRDQEVAVGIDEQIVRIVNSTPGLPAGAAGGMTTRDLDVAKRAWGSTPTGVRTTPEDT